MTYGSVSNREIATAIWFVLLLIWGLTVSNIRASVLALVRSFFTAWILFPVCAMAVYCVVCVKLLGAIGLWNSTLLKDTVLWFCCGALGAMMRLSSSDSGDLFRKMLLDSLKVVILLEYIVSTYTFSLPVEIILTPVLAIVVLCGVAASMDKKYAGVEKLMNGCQIMTGLAILGAAFWGAFHNLRSLVSLETAKTIAFMPLLFTLLVPFLYALAVLSSYQEAFIRLEFGSDKTDSVKRYAKWRLLGHYRLSLSRVQHLAKEHVLDLMKVQTKDDVDKLLRHLD